MVHQIKRGPGKHVRINKSHNLLLLQTFRPSENEPTD
jgi:hypothetical protein